MNGSHFQVEAFASELMLLRTLRHPNIVTLFGAGKLVDGSTFLVGCLPLSISRLKCLSITETCLILLVFVNHTALFVAVDLTIIGYGVFRTGVFD